jgi:hypothetical protein
MRHDAPSFSARLQLLAGYHAALMLLSRAHHCAAQWAFHIHAYDEHAA